MLFDDPSEIEWLDEDNQTAAASTTPDEQSAATTETTQPRPRKPRKRKEKPVSRTTDEQEQQQDNSLFSLPEPLMCFEKRLPLQFGYLYRKHQRTPLGPHN